MDELVVDAVQLVLIVLVPLTLGLPCRQTARVIRVGLEGGHLGDGVDAALEGDLGGGQQLLILLRQFVLLLELRDDLGGEGLEFDLGIHEHQLSELRGKLSPERAVQHGPGPGLGILLQLRLSGIPELRLGIIEGVPGVDAVTDVGEGGQGLDVLVQLLLLQKYGAGLLIAPRRLQPLSQGAVLLLDRVQIRTLIGHFRKFHVPSAFPLYTFKYMQF